MTSTATKREARSYLSQFNPSKQSRARLTSQPEDSENLQSGQPEVNLGNLYLPARAIDESPAYIQTPAPKVFANPEIEPLHVALVKLRLIASISDTTLRGISKTLSQLTQLGLSSLIVIEDEEARPKVYGSLRNGRSKAMEQADRVVAAIESSGVQLARRIDNVTEVLPASDGNIASIQIQGGLRISHRDFLLAPLKRGVIPVITPIGYTPNEQKLVPVDANEVILALAREFAGLHAAPAHDEDPYDVAARIKSLQKQISLDRIMILDPSGGIPSMDRSQSPHVFINLEQEYDLIKEELMQSEKCSQNNVDSHIRNLQLLRDTLGILPPSSSALLTTPEEAANLVGATAVPLQNPGVGTRRQKNPLLHNLLTDKPVFSSSLPPNRSQLSIQADSVSSKPISPTTFVKRGMPVSILPDPSMHVWRPPSVSWPSIQLNDPRIDLPRLVHLIEDSFDRKLDVPHYLSRISNRIAGIIIAGEYEGGALLTWELPPGVPDDGSLASQQRMVPYLDKFAVRKRSQGAGGVADIVFNAMVRNCFPHGVCWRSRRDNPVNKWYFERARGTWKMPGSNWTMFWTTEGVEDGDEMFLDYEGVCKGVLPSWADGKKVID